MGGLVARLRPADDIARLRQALPRTIPGSSARTGRRSIRSSAIRPPAESAATMAPPSVRTLYLHGADDGAIGADRSAGFDTATYLPAAGSGFEVIEGVGHFLHLEQPARISAWVISDWLEGG